MADYKDYYDFAKEPREQLQHSPKWTPGVAPTSTTPSPESQWIPTGPIIPDPMTPWRDEPQKPVSAPVSTGWLCPACGRGNAPWMAVCGCGGRTGVSTTTNHLTITTPEVSVASYAAPSVRCDCCGLPNADRDYTEVGDIYRVCFACAYGTHSDYHNASDPYWPIWHSHSDDGELLRNKNGVAYRRYQFIDREKDGSPKVGMTYYSDEDPDDFK